MILRHFTLYNNMFISISIGKSISYKTDKSMIYLKFSTCWQMRKIPVIEDVSEETVSKILKVRFWKRALQFNILMTISFSCPFFDKKCQITTHMHKQSLIIFFVWTKPLLKSFYINNQSPYYRRNTVLQYIITQY